MSGIVWISQGALDHISDLLRAMAVVPSIKNGDISNIGAMVKASDANLITKHHST